MKAWWPAGHSIGYEHSFTHAIANFLAGLAAGTPISPGFEDSVRVQAVMEAIEESDRVRTWVNVPEV
jgi:predicted dehydrogenase